MIPEKELFNRSTLDGVPLVEMEKIKMFSIVIKLFMKN